MRRKERELVASLSRRMSSKKAETVSRLSYDLSARMGFVLRSMDFGLTRVRITLLCTKQELDRLGIELNSLGFRVEEKK